MAKKKKLLYFFINGQLHKNLLVSRSRDIIVAWNYPEGAKQVYTYSHVLKRHQKAFSTAEVCKMLNRGRISVWKAISGGHINEPQSTYGFDENKNQYAHKWREEDIMELLDYFSSIHRGRPRKDGMVVVNDLPTPREVRAMIHDENILYVKQGERFVPTWKAKELF